MIEYNKCYWIDCLDSERGLPALAEAIENREMEKIGLGIHDAPWGVGIGKTLQEGRNFHGRKSVSYTHLTLPTTPYV